MEPNEYKCAQCNRIFEFGWTEEEARAEQAANGWKNEDCALVCDDCYKMIVAAPTGDGDIPC